MPSDRVRVGLRSTVQMGAEELSLFGDLLMHSRHTNAPICTTAFMAAVIEWASLVTLGRLMPRETTIRKRVEIRHAVATAIGPGLSVEIQIIASNSSEVSLRAICSKDGDDIGGGIHTRTIIGQAS